MLAGAILLFGLVMALLAVGFVRPAAGRRIPGGYWLVGGGLVLPAVVLTPLLIYGLWSGERLFASRAESAVRIDVMARQWEWVFIYRDAEGGTSESVNVMHVPAGRPVQIHMTSADVIHSFWIPRLAGKIDAIPGHVTVLRFTADAPGIYRGQCAEFCGTSHLDMRMDVQAHASAENFAAAVNALPKAAATQPARPGAQP